MGVLYIGLPDGNKYGNRDFFFFSLLPKQSKNNSGTKEAWFLGEQRLKYS